MGIASSISRIELGSYDDSDKLKGSFAEVAFYNNIKVSEAPLYNNLDNYFYRFRFLFICFI